MLTIRRALNTDITALVQLDAHSSTYRPWSARAWATSVTDHAVHILLSDTHPIGAAVTLHCVDNAELLNIVIKTTYQRRGMGHYLLNHVISLLGKQRTHSLFLEVRESNNPARALYEKMGFKKIGIRANYYPTHNGKEHAIVMEKTL